MTVASLVLVVDDDPAIRESMERELRASGYTTVSASDGREGVRTFDSHAPDLILTDLSMPRSDGFELISAIRAKARTPIIVLSVRGDDADKIRALDLGADDYVTKPFSVAELLARIRAQLRRTASAATMLVFDNLIYNFDRHQNNILYDRAGRLWYIDHTRSFKRISELPDLDRIAVCGREFFERLRGVEEAALKRELKPYLDLLEMDALLTRRKLLLAHLEKLIAERGEERVLTAGP